MHFFRKAKDGGPESHVWGYWLAEIKSLFSAVLLRFEDGSREAFHSHAFNSISWVLSGELREECLTNSGLTTVQVYRPSWRPVITRRSTFHKVSSVGRSWVISFRGPWAEKWLEMLPGGKYITLRSGRVQELLG